MVDTILNIGERFDERRSTEPAKISLLRQQSKLFNLNQNSTEEDVPEYSPGFNRELPQVSIMNEGGAPLLTEQ